MLLAAQDYGNKGQRGTICKALADIVSYIPECIKTVTERTIFLNGMQRLDNFETPRYSNWYWNSKNNDPYVLYLQNNLDSQTFRQAMCTPAKNPQSDVE